LQLEENQIQKMSLENAGVDVDDNGFIKVNKEMQTTAPRVFAAGDVVGYPMLETLAAKEGNIAVSNAFAKSSQDKRKINFDEVPRATFTTPEVASVGLTVEESDKRGIECEFRVLQLQDVPKARVIHNTHGLPKMVIVSGTKKIIGMHILAPHAADLIHEGVLAVKFGLTIDNIIDTVHVFPTLSEATKLAAQSFYSDVSKLSCCTE